MLFSDIFECKKNISGIKAKEGWRKGEWDRDWEKEEEEERERRTSLEKCQGEKCLFSEAGRVPYLRVGKQEIRKTSDINKGQRMSAYLHTMNPTPRQSGCQSNLLGSWLIVQHSDQESRKSCSQQGTRHRVEDWLEGPVRILPTLRF